MSSIVWVSATAGRRGRAWCAIVCVALFAIGCSRDAGQSRQAARYDVGDASVALLLSPTSPREGENEISCELRRGDGAPLEGATVVLVASMPAMATMPYMESRATAIESKPGVYRARYSLSMQGDWDLDLIAS